MDLANLINQLESIIESGRKVPVANKTLVDTEQILSVIGQLRASIPKDIQEAKEMLEKREQILNQSLAEAKRVTANAISEAKTKLDQNELVKEAQKKAEELLEDSQRRAQRMIEQADIESKNSRLGADAYAQEVLHKLEQEVSDVLSTVRRGIEVLDLEQQPASGEQEE